VQIGKNAENAALRGHNERRKPGNQERKAPDFWLPASN
jgi:hypothetical protein